MAVDGMRQALSDRYTIERELGRGGMATVFLANDARVNRQVAIKVLHPELAAALGGERFHREIQIATHLTHPNILPVYDSGEADGTLYYVMPFVEGESLRHRLDRERQLGIDAAIRITCQIASALDYAHQANIVHRDIKPENILIEAGQAVLADFGIARAVTSAADTEALTRTGMSLGTPAYMSPEQAMGERNLDGRSDQYALACVTYEMLAGQPPFTAPTMQALIARHIAEQVPLITTVRAAVPDEVQDVVLQALEKVPADRFPTMKDFADALADAASMTMTATSRRATPPRSMRTTTRTSRIERRRERAPWRRRALAAAAIATVAIVAGVGARQVWFAGPHLAAAAGDIASKRVGVLYLADASKDGSLRYLADGLTENLIDRLREARLDVASRQAVLPYRGANVRMDSVARALAVGAVIDGTVEQQGSVVHVSVRLLDGPSGSEFRRASFDVQASSLLTAGDSLANEAVQLLRPWLGEQIQLRDQLAKTRDVEAWKLFQHGERLRKDAVAQAGADPRAAMPLFRTADSLLSLAEARDPSWPDPVVLRGTAMLHRARSAGQPRDSLRSWIESGLSHADRALKRAPRDANALELRGTLRWAAYQQRLSRNPAEEESLLRAAGEDLRAAVTANPARASAWAVLSAVAYRKFDLVEANLHARRAYEEDAYLANADEVLWRLFATSYDLDRAEDASRWCGEGFRRFPAEWRFSRCRLLLYLMTERTPDVNAAWSAANGELARVPSARRQLSERQTRMLVAVVLARAGLADSARSVIPTARADRQIDPERDLAWMEALVRVRLGERAAAISLLKDYLTEFPQHRRGLTRNTWWWSALRDDPDFRTLVATGA